MKKYVFVFLILSIFLTITGCSASNNSDVYSGKETYLSKHYLSKGYMFNIYRSSESLGDDDENYGKAYIQMSFNILTEYTSTFDYDTDENNKIKKMTVTNVKILSTTKKGDIEDIAILKQYSQSLNDPKVDVKSTKSKYEIVYDTPHTSGVQSSIWINLNKIALYDQTTSIVAKQEENPTLSQIYNELGIELSDVTLKIGFRIELLTVGGKILYKDYEITTPPSNVDITASEFHYEYLETDVKKMKPFLEKE